MEHALWLHEPFDYWAQTRPGSEFAIADGRITTYADAAARADEFAAALASCLEPGERFGVLSKNSVDMLLLYFAASKAGVVPVPLNYRLAPPEWEYILGDSGARLLYAQDQFVPAVDSIRAGVPTVTTLVSDEGGAAWRAIDEWRGPRLGTEYALARRHHEAFQMYTSGTTGRPKGAVLSHPALSASRHQWRIAFPLVPGERVLVVAPIYHVSGTLNSFHAVEHGSPVHVMSDFDAMRVVDAIEQQRIAMMFMVPFMINECLAVDGVERRDFSSFRLIYYGGSAIAEATLRRAMDVFGCDFVQSFGMTECASPTYLTPDDHRRALVDAPHLLESTGRAGPGSALKIVDEHDVEVPPGTIGEICCRGPQTMDGYWKLPDATAEALRDGWMRTGDAGYLDDEGYLFVKDRVKDMIVSGGENVYPREVEDVLFGHPDVADAAVIGVPSDRWGETVKAVVVRARGSDVSEEDLIEFCRARIAGYKRPRSVDFVDELPRNPSGKVLKRLLRDRYWTGHDRRVG